MCDHNAAYDHFQEYCSTSPSLDLAQIASFAAFCSQRNQGHRFQAQNQRCSGFPWTFQWTSWQNCCIQRKFWAMSNHENNQNTNFKPCLNSLPSFSLVFGIGGPWDDTDILPQLTNHQINKSDPNPLKNLRIHQGHYPLLDSVTQWHTAVAHQQISWGCCCTAQRNKICPAVLPCHSLIDRLSSISAKGEHHKNPWQTHMGGMQKPWIPVPTNHSGQVSPICFSAPCRHAKARTNRLQTVWVRWYSMGLWVVSQSLTCWVICEA